MLTPLDKGFMREARPAAGIMTIEAIRYIIRNKLEFDNYYKISGRYYINDNFKYDKLENKKSVFFKDKNHNIINTTLYKLRRDKLILLHDFLIKNYDKMCRCIGYEDIMMLFTNEINDDNCKIIEGAIYTSGLVSVDGTKFNIDIKGI